jgi:tetratricopeptide (TPR) repeat protein
MDNAVDYARQSIDFADQSGDILQRIGKRTALADALHQSGSLKEAEDTFKKAEEMQKERLPEYPILTSQGGLRYCDLLLGQGKYGEVINRAKKCFEWHLSGNALSTIALDHLSLGRAYLLKAQAEDSDFTQADEHLDQAVVGLKQAGAQEFIIRGLLARASLRRFKGNFDDAKHDVDEAFAIAQRGSMGLYLPDCHLEYARLYLAMGEKDKAKTNLDTAKGMITRIGYHRRDKEVQELEKQLSGTG